MHNIVWCFGLVTSVCADVQPHDLVCHNIMCPIMWIQTLYDYDVIWSTKLFRVVISRYFSTCTVHTNLFSLAGTAGQVHKWDTTAASGGVQGPYGLQLTWRHTHTHIITHFTLYVCMYLAVHSDTCIIVQSSVMCMQSTIFVQLLILYTELLFLRFDREYCV